MFWLKFSKRKKSDFVFIQEDANIVNTIFNYQSSREGKLTFKIDEKDDLLKTLFILCY